MTSETIAAYSAANQRRILEACPHASEVRTFHGWLAAGRVVSKGQKGIRLVAPDEIDARGKISSIKPVYLFDVTQTQERTLRAALSIRASVPGDHRQVVWNKANSAVLGFGSGPVAHVRTRSRVLTIARNPVCCDYLRQLHIRRKVAPDRLRRDAGPGASGLSGLTAGSVALASEGA